MVESRRCVNPNIVVLWVDEKVFMVHKHIACRNTHLRCADPDLRTIHRSKNPTKAMVLGLMASHGRKFRSSLSPVERPSSQDLLQHSDQAHVEVDLRDIYTMARRLAAERSPDA